jgi:transposase
MPRARYSAWAQISDPIIGDAQAIPFRRMHFFGLSEISDIFLLNLRETIMKNKQLSERKRKRVQKHLEQINLFAAGIDIGSREHYVAVPESLAKESVRVFSCFTSDLESMADWLVQIGITTVAMESTGIYWIPAFEILESRGLEVILVNARHVKNVSGRKTDVKDCQWIQQLHTYGLLAGAFRPEDHYCVLRAYMRQREMLVSSIAVTIQHMQKSLRQMNLLLDNVVTDITGQTGVRIIRAILSGERDAKKLASFRDGRCKSSLEEITQSLLGNYRKEHLFTLKQSVELYDTYHTKLKDCDREIENQLDELEKQPASTSLPAKNRRKKNNQNAMKFNVVNYLYEICGTDLTEIDGLDEHSVLKIVSETGVNMDKWETEKHFVSWLGLSPNNKISGGKILSSKTIKTQNRAKQVFKLAAFALSNSKSGLGAFYRRIRARLGAPKAINATARKVAIIFYNMIKFKTAFRSQTQEEYDELNKKRIMKNLKQKAKQFGLELVPMTA